MTKGFLPIHESLYQYMVKSTCRESEHQRALREATTAQDARHAIMTTPEQAQLLTFMVKAMGAKRAIEVGVYTGYGTLAIAKGMGKSGKLYACDRNDSLVNLGKPFWKSAAVDHLIEFRAGMAEDTMNALIEEGEAGQIDFIFVDADKVSYPQYYELGLKLLRQGGIMIFDNVLWVGEVSVETQSNPATKAVHQLLHQAKQDAQVELTCLPLSSGMLLIRKEG